MATPRVCESLRGPEQDKVASLFQVKAALFAAHASSAKNASKPKFVSVLIGTLAQFGIEMPE
jgi:hypothetical protein